MGKAKAKGDGGFENVSAPKISVPTKEMEPSTPEEEAVVAAAAAAESKDPCASPSDEPKKPDDENRKCWGGQVAVPRLHLGHYREGVLRPIPHHQRVRAAQGADSTRKASSLQAAVETPPVQYEKGKTP